MCSLLINLFITQHRGEWNFGDGNSSFDPNPSHAYLLDGSYDVQLIASNSYGSTPLFTTTLLMLA